MADDKKKPTLSSNLMKLKFMQRAQEQKRAKEAAAQVCASCTAGNPQTAGFAPQDVCTECCSRVCP
jgi:hypothetical protein